MKLKHILLVLVFLLLVYELVEFYVIFSVEPAFVEVSRINMTGRGNYFTEVRLYFPNTYFLPVRVSKVVVTVNCSNGVLLRGELSSVTLMPRTTSILHLNSSTPEPPRGACKVTYSWVPDPLITHLVGLHLLNFTRVTEMQTEYEKQPFLWAGWQSLDVRLGDCVYFQVYTYPPSTYKADVLADYLSLPNVPIYSVAGYGSGLHEFCPKEPSSFRLKGYYIVVTANGRTWTQADSYPPRLKVSP
ncbi:hypothetical protein IG193_07195 [Infirmifilum lucidum]|uniref:Uncharacterized protein n=1 Tax=Infirmifilum lucidum TaxID=2776706 RepID=A0A7L9FHZ6_9CREN|nr:hypothetical protein [Infirmifilum lucidum]QOJ78534.1 hypothetical protein IG193_07195 [Infirmifilum lucidum]